MEGSLPWPAPPPEWVLLGACLRVLLGAQLSEGIWACIGSGSEEGCGGGQRGQSYLCHKGPSWRCQGGHVPVVVLLVLVGRLQGLFGAW